MILTNKQEQGLKEAVTRYTIGDRYIVVSGYAGSGKSTLVSFIIDALKVPLDEVVYAAYTGKAAQVLVKKGNKNAITLHKLLYESYPMSDGSFMRVAKKNLNPYKVVVVDEVSMVPLEMIQLLAKYKVFLIFLGDPGQLPPIDKNTDNHLLDHPHVFLDEIMRQAQESEIIRLTMAIREGKPIQEYHGKEVQIFNKQDYDMSMLPWADQVICATNTKRAELNNKMREMAGKSGEPQNGDKVLCLRNYWDILDRGENPLVNGSIGYLINPYGTFIQYPYSLGGGMYKITHTDFESDSHELYSGLNLDTHMIETGEKCCSPQTVYKINQNKKWSKSLPLEFTYGYAITCHKSQGSSWPNVLVIEENFPFGREEHARWLYTACTRPEQKLVLIKK